MLRHYDPRLPCTVETDASDYALGAVLLVILDLARRLLSGVRGDVLDDGGHQGLGSGEPVNQGLVQGIRQLDGILGAKRTVHA